MHSKRNGTLKQLQANWHEVLKELWNYYGRVLTPHGKTGSLFCQSPSRHDIHPLSGNLSPPRNKTRSPFLESPDN